MYVETAAPVLSRGWERQPTIHLSWWSWCTSPELQPCVLRTASHRGWGSFITGAEYTWALPAAAGVLKKSLTTASPEKNWPGWYTLQVCGICWFLTVADSCSQRGVVECGAGKRQISGAWCWLQHVLPAGCTVSSQPPKLVVSHYRIYAVLS